MRIETSKQEQELINRVTWNNMKHPEVVKEITPENKPSEIKKFLDGANEVTNKLFNEEDAKKWGGINFEDFNKGNTKDKLFSKKKDNPFDLDEDDPLGLNKMDLGI